MGKIEYLKIKNFSKPEYINISKVLNPINPNTNKIKFLSISKNKIYEI